MFSCWRVPSVFFFREQLCRCQANIGFEIARRGLPNYVPGVGDAGDDTVSEKEIHDYRKVVAKELSRLQDTYVSAVEPEQFDQDELDKRAETAIRAVRRQFLENSPPKTEEEEIRERILRRNSVRFRDDLGDRSARMRAKAELEKKRNAESDQPQKPEQGYKVVERWKEKKKIRKKKIKIKIKKNKLFFFSCFFLLSFSCFSLCYWFLETLNEKSRTRWLWSHLFCFIQTNHFPFKKKKKPGKQTNQHSINTLLSINPQQPIRKRPHYHPSSTLMHHNCGSSYIAICPTFNFYI